MTISLPGTGQGLAPREGTEVGEPKLAEARRSQVPYSFLAPAQGPNELGWLSYFRVLGVLGEGGMGLVFLAEDTRLKRRVALKVVKPVLAADASSRGRSLRKARATAALEHDNIIAIHHMSSRRTCSRCCTAGRTGRTG